MFTHVKKLADIIPLSVFGLIRNFWVSFFHPFSRNNSIECVNWVMSLVNWTKYCNLIRKKLIFVLKRTECNCFSNLLTSSPLWILILAMLKLKSGYILPGDFHSGFFQSKQDIFYLSTIFSTLEIRSTSDKKILVSFSQ